MMKTRARRPRSSRMSTQPRGVLGPQLVRRGFLWWCAGLSCSCGRARQGAVQQARAAVSHSDPQICHRKPPLSPAPRPSSIAYSNTGTSLRETTGACSCVPCRGHDRARALSLTRKMSARRQAQTRRAQPRPWTGAVVIATRSEGEGSWNAIKSIPRDRVIAG